MRGKHRQKTSLWFLQKEMNRQGKQSRIDWFKSFQQALGCESGPQLSSTRLWGDFRAEELLDWLVCQSQIKDVVVGIEFGFVGVFIGNLFTISRNQLPLEVQSLQDQQSPKMSKHYKAQKIKMKMTYSHLIPLTFSFSPPSSPSRGNLVSVSALWPPSIQQYIPSPGRNTSYTTALSHRLSFLVMNQK